LVSRGRVCDLGVAGGKHGAYMGGEIHFPFGEVVLGEFLDAFNAGEQVRQNRIEEERRKTAAAQQKVHDAIGAADKWVSDVLGPVMVEVHNDLASVGDVTIADVSRPPIVARDVTIALTGHKATKLSFHVREDGTINVYQDGGNGNTIGAITTTFQEQIKDLFRKTIHSLSEM
jgi:hypothetical protein